MPVVESEKLALCRCFRVTLAVWGFEINLRLNYEIIENMDLISICVKC